MSMPPMVAELSWSKIYLILEKCKDSQERKFYFRMTHKWLVKDVLIHNITIKTFRSIFWIWQMYALKSAMVPMGVAANKKSNELPEEMKQLFPEPEESLES